LANTGASAAILAQADATNAICGFNGNDAIVLKKNGNIIDVIGIVGNNPITSWPVGAGFTADFTLVRNANVDAPTNSWLTSQSQWTSYPVGTTSYLGSNINNCSSVAIVPIANFTSNIQSISTGQSINFTDLSTNNPTSWNWSFTGAVTTSSTSQNPTNIIYNNPGCYQVALTATNSAGSNTSTQTCYINVTNPVIVPVANFTASSVNITAGQFVNFTDLSTNNPTSWNWSFNGASTAFSNVQNPANILYNTPGCFQVSLTATNSAGSNTSTQTCYITVTNPIITPVANFSANTQYINVGQSVNFTDLSSNNPTSWNWIFMGAATTSSTAQNPTNISYDTAGCFEVALTATNSAGSNTSTQTCYINVVPTGIQPQASFSINPNPACTFTNINLVNNSTNALSFNWDMPGASPANTTDQFPVISFAIPGTYQIKLIAYNGVNSDSLTQTITVHPKPTVNAGADVGICFGTSINLNASAVGALSYNWTPVANLATPNQSSTLASPTSNTDYVITVSDGICSASDTITINVWPLPFVPTISQLGNTLEATPGFPSYQWYFNSILMAGETQATINPTSNGDYTVDAIDTNGCVATSNSYPFVIQGINSTSNNEIRIYPNPASTALLINMYNYEFEFIRVNDIQGKLVFEKQITNNQIQTIDLQNWSKGYYTIDFIGNNSVIHKKFMKN
jgi:PKD repeat protein